MKDQINEWNLNNVHVPYIAKRRRFVEYHDKPSSMTNDNRSERAQVIWNIKNLPFAYLQRRRFNYLVQKRLTNNTLKLNCRRYPKFGQNLSKIFEIFNELVIEALRAPRDPVNEERNPYIRIARFKKIKDNERYNLLEREELEKYYGKS